MRLPVLLLLLAGLGLGCRPAGAQQRDPSFHNAHFSLPTGATGPVTIRTVLRQNDGKYVVAGNFAAVDNHATQGIARLLGNGRPDSTFMAAVGGHSGPLAVQPDGRLLLARPDSTRPLCRLLPDGRPDTSFVLTVSAVVRTRLRHCSAILPQPDGRLVVAGPETLVRLLPDGQQDSSFQAPAFPAGMLLGSVSLESDGRLSYVGYYAYSVGGPEAISVERLLPTGQPDPGFTGLTFLRAVATALLRLADGRYLLGGTFVSIVLWRGNVLRLSAAGVVDTTFYSSHIGSLVSGSWLSSPVSALAELPDGRLLVAGYHRSSFGIESPLRSFYATGYDDGSFDPNFITTPDSIVLSNSIYYFNKARVSALAVEPNGKIMVAGSFVRVGGQPSGGLTRLLPAQPLAAAAPVGTLLDVWPNPAHEVLRLRSVGPEPPRRVALLDMLGRPVYMPAAASELSMDVRHLPAGMYVLRIDYAKRAVTRRVLVR